MHCIHAPKLICLCTRWWPLRDVSRVCLLQIKLPKTFEYRSLCKPVCPFYLERVLLLNFLGPTVNVCFTWTVKLFSKEVPLLYISTSDVWYFQLFFILTGICYCQSFLFHFSHPSKYKMILFAIFICISLITNDAEHLSNHELICHSYSFTNDI